MFYVGVVGHRYLAGSAVEAFVCAECSKFLRQLRQEEIDLVAISAIAEGADTLFAETALSLDIPLELVRPFEEYAEDFESPVARERYQRLRLAARTEERLPFVKRSDIAYRAAMDWVIERADEMVVVWNGRPPEGLGGTGAAVKQLTELDRSWLYLDVVRLAARLVGRGDKIQEV